MSQVPTLGRSYLRQYKVDGVSASGENEPDKAEGRAAFDRIGVELQAEQAAREAAVAGEAAARTTADSEMSGQIDTIETRLTNVEEIAEGGVRSPLEPVDLATTANITLSGEKTIDGETTSASTVLVKDQTNELQNGIYTTASGSWTRRADADTGEEIYLRKVLVREGSANGGTIWQCTNLTAPNIGSDAINWVQTGTTDSVSVAVKTEVENARGGHPTLSDRLDEFANADLVTSSLVVDYFDLDTVVIGYISTTGTRSASSSWRTTQLIPVTQGQTFRFTGNGNSSVGAISYFNADREWIGTEGYIPTATDMLFTTTDPDVAFIAASANASAARSLTISRPMLEADGTEYNKILAVSTGLTEDFFEDPDNVSQGYVNLSGQFIASNVQKSTKVIPVHPGQVFIYTGFVVGSTVSAVSVYDSNLQFVESALTISGSTQVTDAPVRISHPDAAYVRASARDQDGAGDVFKFIGAASVGGGGGGETSFDVSSFDPRVVYGLAGEPLRIYPRNLCADRSVSLATNLPNSNEEFVPINSPVAGTTSVQMRARRGQQVATLFNFNIVISDTPVSPASALNVIVLGDSTTAQYNDDGAATNELARRLTGTGTSIADSATGAGFTWTGPAMPTPLGLSNIFFRGTRGSGPVKHEGRNGWRALDYTTAASKGAVTNAFWDPVNGRFSPEYYVAQNQFGVADDPVNGIAADGSNLLFIASLGWNDVYQDDDTDTGSAAAAARLAALIDEIHADMPNARVLIVGLNPAPRSNFKGLSSPRFVSQEEVFEVVVRAYGNAFRQVCDLRSNTDFHALAPVFDPEIAYGTSTYARAFRSTETYGGAGDHVHSRPPGYAMWADAVYYWIINQYCQGA